MEGDPTVGTKAARRATRRRPKGRGWAAATKDRDWDWSEHEPEQTDALLEEGGWKAMAEAHAWYDDTAGDPPEQKGAYKLPHHELIDGRLMVIWRGVTHAMNVLVGGRGGVRIPDQERKAVWSHLAEHYRQFGEDPPDLDR